MVGEVLTVPHLETYDVTKRFTRPRTWTDILVRHKHRKWEYNIKMDLQDVGWGMDWTTVAQDRDRKADV